MVCPSCGRVAGENEPACLVCGRPLLASAPQEATDGVADAQPPAPAPATPPMEQSPQPSVADAPMWAAPAKYDPPAAPAASTSDNTPIPQQLFAPPAPAAETQPVDPAISESISGQPSAGVPPWQAGAAAPFQEAAPTNISDMSAMSGDDALVAPPSGQPLASQMPVTQASSPSQPGAQPPAAIPYTPAPQNAAMSAPQPSAFAEPGNVTNPPDTSTPSYNTPNTPYIPTPYASPPPHSLGEPGYMPTTPAPYSQPMPPTPTPSPYGQPPQYGQPIAPQYGQPQSSPYGQPVSPMPYGQPLGATPGGPPPIPSPSLPYGQPQMPPGYGQFAPPSMPIYGAGIPYGQAAPPSTAPGYGPGGTPPLWGGPPLPPQPPRRSNTGLLIGSISAVVIVVLILGFVAVKALGGSFQAQTAVPPAATSTTAPTATPNSIIYQSSLMGTPDGWSNDANCSPRSDGYHISDGYVCFSPSGDFTDGTISVQVKQASGSKLDPYGIAFRYDQQTDQRYEFDLDSNGKWVVFKCPGGSHDCTELVPYTANAAIHSGLNSTNTLKVVVQGGHFDFYVNDTKVGAVDDSAYSSGLVGLDGSTGIVAVFANFEITK